MRPDGNTILITGGGSGIGAALARAFADEGNHVIVAGRRRAALDAVIDGRANISTIAFDIDDPASIRSFATRVVAEHPTLNVLINNAGIMRYERIDRPRDLTDAEATITTNLLGPIRLIDALVGHLSAQPDAAIVNVTSGLAFVPFFAAATYSATKAAIHSYTQVLREQLRGRVEVIELAPPGVQTDLTPGQSAREGYMPLADYISEVMELFARTPTPEEILVERVRPLRFAEAEGRFDAAFAQLGALARKVM